MAGRAGRRGTSAAASGTVRDSLRVEEVSRPCWLRCLPVCAHPHHTCIVVLFALLRCFGQVVLCGVSGRRVNALLTGSVEPLRGFLTLRPSFLLKLLSLAHHADAAIASRVRRAVSFAFASFGSTSFASTHTLRQLAFSLRWLRSVHALTPRFNVRRSCWPPPPTQRHLALRPDCLVCLFDGACS